MCLIFHGLWYLKAYSDSNLSRLSVFVGVVVHVMQIPCFNFLCLLENHENKTSQK